MNNIPVPDLAIGLPVVGVPGSSWEEKCNTKVIPSKKSKFTMV